MKNLKTNIIYLALTGKDKDPTRTITLRSQFSKDMISRFNKISIAVRKKIVEENFLAPVKKTSVEMPNIIPLEDYEYRWSTRKKEQFMDWLQEQIDENVLETSYGPVSGAEPWSNTYIQSAYQKGMVRARSDLRRAGLDIPTFGPSGDSLSAVFNRPFHADRVGLIYSRVFTDLKGVTSAMSTQMSRELALGMSQGKHPRQIAKNLTDRIDKIGKARGTLIARTEVINSHNQAALNEYESAEGIIGDEVQVQWWTAQDERVRASHRERHAKVYEREEARELLGEPNCRCSLLPYIPAIMDEPILPESQQYEKERIMQSALDYTPCFTTSLITNIIANKPQECNDYVRNTKGEILYKGKKVQLTKAEEQRIRNLAIPPAWTDVVISKDIKAKIQAIGKDAAGELQYRYSAEWIAGSSKRKFEKLKSFNRDIEQIRKKIALGIKNKDPRAYLLGIENETAIRIGNVSKRKTKKIAYGLTTLQNRHVKVEGEKIKLNFVAKKGVPASYTIRNKTLATFLEERKKTYSGKKDSLFPDVNSDKLNAYLQEVSGKKYTIKDFRTYYGTAIAKRELSKYNNKGIIFDEKQRKKIVKEVTTTVSNFLKNTPAVAKSAYIDPMVWEIIGGLP